jgi:hypothetical protein
MGANAVDEFVEIGVFAHALVLPFCPTHPISPRGPAQTRNCLRHNRARPLRAAGV